MLQAEIVAYLVRNDSRDHFAPAWNVSKLSPTNCAMPSLPMLPMPLAEFSLAGPNPGTIFTKNMLITDGSVFMTPAKDPRDKIVFRSLVGRELAVALIRNRVVEAGNRRQEGHVDAGLRPYRINGGFNTCALRRIAEYRGRRAAVGERRFNDLNVDTVRDRRAGSTINAAKLTAGQQMPATSAKIARPCIPKLLCSRFPPGAAGG